MFIVKHFYHKPVARGIGRPPPVYLTLNKLSYLILGSLTKVYVNVYSLVPMYGQLVSLCECPAVRLNTEISHFISTLLALILEYHLHV